LYFQRIETSPLVTAHRRLRRRSTRTATIIAIVALCSSGAPRPLYPDPVRAVLVVLVPALLAACVVGAPPGFSPGESWTFPLVDPLAHMPLITTVTVQGKGPFLFILDPDAPTGIDGEFVAQMPTVGNSPSFAPLGDVQIGTLHVDSLPFVQRKLHAFDVGGRRIAGVIGYEVFTGGLVFGFDRDRGVAWLATPKHASVAPASRTFSYWERHGDRGPYITGAVDGHSREFHIDLGRSVNRLRTELWEGLAVTSAQRRVVLASAKPLTTDKVATAKQVTVGSLEQVGVEFAPFSEDGVVLQTRSATLGLDFFWPFTVAVDFDSHQLHLAPRATISVATRVSRWNRSCKHAGCAELLLHGNELEVIPEHAPSELVVRAVAHDGSPLPDLEINLAAGAERFGVTLPDAYDESLLEVIDASPFPRQCADANECVVPMN
jgi:hypothetical protein